MPSQYLIWDFDGTLAFREGMWSQAVVDVVNRNFSDVSLTRTDISNYLSSGFFWHSPDVSHLHVTNSTAWWHHHFEIFENAIVAETGLDSKQVHPVLPQIREEFLDPASWTVYSDVLSCLTELSVTGWKHIVLSNHVPELSTLMENLGLLRMFESVFTSAEIGYEKPNRLAFQAVTKMLPTESKRWMIGDNYNADVVGANKAGIKAILVRKNNEHANLYAKTLHEIRGILELNR